MHRIMLVLLKALSSLNGHKAVARFVLVASVLFSTFCLAQLPKNFAHLPDDVQALLLEYAFFSDQVHNRWGEQSQFASKQAYVKYLDDYLSRAKVDYSSGVVTVETLASSQPELQLKAAIVKTLLTPEDPNGVDIYSAEDIKEGQVPFLHKRVLDHQRKPIRYHWRAVQFAKHLIQSKLQSIQTPQGNILRVQIPMVADRNRVSAHAFGDSVRHASHRFNIPESLILGVIETESEFNPYAVSPASAYGLMQVVPKTAGADVFQKIFKKSGQPSRQYLFKPDNNILVGTAYLSILRDNYLSGIRHPTSQLYCIISAYNSGSGNVLKTFHANRKLAIARINALSPEDVLWKLKTHHPSSEARHYVKKVLANQSKYSG